MWGTIGRFLLKGGKWLLSAVASGAAAYGGYTVAENLISSGEAQKTASASAQATTVFDWKGLLISMLVACGVTLLIYIIRKKRGK